FPYTTLFRSVRGHLVRRVDRFHHHVEDVEAGVAGLLESGGQDGGRDAVQLGVELEGGHELLGAGDLEVHVAEGVLRTEDVGEGDVVRLAVDLLGDQAHGDAGDRGLEIGRAHV